MASDALPLQTTATLSLPPAWAALVAALPDAAYVQTLNAQVVMVNQPLVDMLGVAREQIIGRTCHEVFDCTLPTGHPPASCARIAKLAPGTQCNEEICGRFPSQRLTVRSTPILAEDQTICAYLTVIRPVSELVNLEREQGRFEHLARFGELAASLAHEIKNPLTGIQGAMDIMLSRRAPTDPERAILENVKTEVKRINNIIQMLLERARPRPLIVRAVSVNETAQQAVQLARISLLGNHAQRLRIEFQPAPENPRATLDVTQIEDALLNLILNAVEAIAHAGTITVTVNHEPGAETVTIAVRDTGHGIQASELTRIFSPFYSTRLHSTGLGLPAVRRIARAHGGQITVQSEPGQGSTFTLHLPCQHDQQTA